MADDDGDVVERLVQRIDALEADLRQERGLRHAADAALLEVGAERDRLRAVMDAADDFWPLIESIYDSALATWEYADSRMKYVTVQISKVDLPTLLAAYASPLDRSEATDG